MKLWGFLGLWTYFRRYWNKIAQQSKEGNPGQPLQSTIQQTKAAQTNSSNQKKRKLYKFSFKDASVSLDQSKSLQLKKRKRIFKRSSQNPINANKQSEQSLNALTNKSGEEISSIGSKESSDSEDTVKEILTNMEPKFTKPRQVFNQNNVRRQQAREMMLVNQLFGEKIKNRLDNNKFPFPMKKGLKNNIPIYDASKRTPFLLEEIKQEEKSG